MSLIIITLINVVHKISTWFCEWHIINVVDQVFPQQVINEFIDFDDKKIAVKGIQSKDVCSWSLVYLPLY